MQNLGQKNKGLDESEYSGLIKGGGDYFITFHISMYACCIHLSTCKSVCVSL